MESVQNIRIKKVKPEDIGQLQKISRETFIETFSAANSGENMKKYLEEELSIEKLTAELGDRDSAFYFAVIDENVIGYLKLNVGQSQTELKDDNSVEIERIYTLKE